MLKEGFHQADLEGEAQQRYDESMRLIVGLQKYQPGNTNDDWAWYCLELLDWLKLHAYYDEYVSETTQPWPHRYIMQDIIQAFMTMALFSPELEVTGVVQDYLGTEEGSKFRESLLFDPLARSKQRPDSRTRTSSSERPASFWKEWHAILQSDGYWMDSYPWEWNMAVRPILAKRK